MKKLFLMMSVLLSAGLFCACSKDGEEGLNEGSVEAYEGLKEGQSFALGDMNILHIQKENGPTETNWLYQPYCGISSSVWMDGDEIYPIVFSAEIRNSTHFNVLQFDLNSTRIKSIEDLKVGDTFGDIHFPSSEIMIKTWESDSVSGLIPHESKGGALSGQIDVVNKKTGDDGKSHLIMSLKDVKFHQEDGFYILNAVIDFEICEGGEYPNPPQEIDMEELLTPTDDLMFFMMDALYKNETQGRQTFFGEESEKQECLIINSYQELREAYKGDRNIFVGIPFEYCTLVIGRTYGEHGGITIGDFDLVDNGDSYQLNLTLNNNVNPNYAYTDAVKDLYFWKLIPKIENKPIVLNRIIQDVNINPYGNDSAYAKMRNRWLLQCHVDADGTFRQVSRDWGDENYTIEFKENGRVEGRIGANTFSGYYILPYSYVLNGKYDNWNGDYIYGVINLWDVAASNVYDDDPLSETFKHIFNATLFKIWTSGDKVYTMTMRTPDQEIFGFFYENIKKNYGYK